MSNINVETLSKELIRLHSKISAHTMVLAAVALSLKDSKGDNRQVALETSLKDVKELMEKSESEDAGRDETIELIDRLLRIVGS